MTWAEIEQLTQRVQQQTSQQLSQVMVSAHSTMIEGSRVTVLEAMFCWAKPPPWGRASRWKATTCLATTPAPSTWH